MNAHVNNPSGVFVSNGEVFIADTENHRVRKLLRNGQIVIIAGTGIAGYNGDGELATDAQLDFPISVVVSSSNQVYISEKENCLIRKIDQNGIISTIAGNGVVTTMDTMVIGPKKKALIKPFPKSYLDLTITTISN